MQELRTCYPFGLNSRFNNKDMLDNVSNINVFKFCFKPLQKVDSSTYNSITLTPSSSQIQNLSFNSEYELLNHCIKSCKCHSISPCMEMFTLIAYICERANKLLTSNFIKLIAYKLHTTLDYTINQQFLYACVDYFNARLSNTIETPISKTPPKIIL